MTALAPVLRPSDTPSRADDGVRDAALTLLVLALVVTACLPLAKVYIGLGFLRPVLGAATLSVALAWLARRFDAGPVGSLALSVAGWAMFVSLAFLGHSLAAGILPTPATLDAFVALWGRGLELLQLRPAPAFAEAGLLLLTVTGVWAVAHAVEGLVFRLASPLKAVAMALVLWTVPLALAPASGNPWAWSVPLALSAAALLLAFSGADLARWGRWVAPSAARGRASRHPLLPAGAAITVVAVAAGVLFADALPGAGAPPWYEMRGLTGTTVTTNPIVNIRARLVAEGGGPVLRVRATRPVYLRTTALDVYSDTEEWTNAGIHGDPVSDGIPPVTTSAPAEHVRVDVTVEGLEPGAVLVPAPYGAVDAFGPASANFLYDPHNATFTMRRGAVLEPGASYSVVAAVPAPDPAALLDATVADPTGMLTALPPQLPPVVGELARAIVDGAGATTPFEQALAIQNELRSWTYSTDPPPGHGASAMEAFLSTRIGYCEQYAGTMAVMLRTLGIPARVAVGYSPGVLVDANESEYVITNENAHAWVEVLFPGYGWLAFEPTPRSDGNVLVPTTANLAPDLTEAQRVERDLLSRASNAIDDAQAERELLRNNGGQPTAAPGAAPDAPVPGGAGVIPGSRSLLLLVALAVLLGLLAAAGFAVRRTRIGGFVTRSPVERVLGAHRGVTQLGRALGVAPQRWETDQQYLGRLATRRSADRDAAAGLAAAVGRARYATSLPEESAVAAEAAAHALTASLVAPLSRRARAGVRARLALQRTRGAAGALTPFPRPSTARS